MCDLIFIRIIKAILVGRWRSALFVSMVLLACALGCRGDFVYTSIWESTNNKDELVICTGDIHAAPRGRSQALEQHAQLVAMVESEQGCLVVEDAEAAAFPERAEVPLQRPIETHQHQVDKNFYKIFEDSTPLISLGRVKQFPVFNVEFRHIITDNRPSGAKTEALCALVAKLEANQQVKSCYNDLLVKVNNVLKLSHSKFFHTQDAEDIAYMRPSTLSQQEIESWVLVGHTLYRGTNWYEKFQNLANSDANQAAQHVWRAIVSYVRQVEDTYSHLLTAYIAYAVAQKDDWAHKGTNPLFIAAGLEHIYDLEQEYLPYAGYRCVYRSKDLRNVGDKLRPFNDAEFIENDAEFIDAVKGVLNETFTVSRDIHDPLKRIIREKRLQKKSHDFISAIKNWTCVFAGAWMVGCLFAKVMNHYFFPSNVSAQQ